MKDNLEPFKRSIEIWNIHLPDHRQDTDSCRTLLNREELERASKFLKPSDSDGFILCRGLLRRILGGCLSADPAELVFNRNAQGKPFLQDSRLEFNVSHSRDRLLIAVTGGRAVGVDIEFRRTGLNMQSIAKRWFAPAEQEFFQTLEHPETGFFDIWAKKEAYVKALGIGIYKELNTFAVPLGEAPFFPPEHSEKGSVITGQRPKEVATLGTDGQWFFQTLEIDSGYAAAVVSEAPPIPVNLRTL
jgi:4'-phosphopantetheinyl transferase